ncbi:MAG TPA: transketolase [Bacteroidales bacterium]|nr:transketolase [Bacteroidales bacterium]
MATPSIRQLQKTSLKIRQDVIRSLTAAGSGHLGGSLGLADIFTVLYFNTLTHFPKEPTHPNRDRLILSIGHVAPVLYATLANAGYFPREELLTLRKLGSRLQGHPGRDHGLPGIEISAGSLGQGLSVAVGMALSAKIENSQWQVYSVHGDGKLQEGSIWEAAMSAAHYKLDNLTAIVDRNFCQIDGYTHNVMELEPLKLKWEAFGWRVFECNGNSIAELVDIFSKTKKITGKPKVIIAKTQMGFGVKSIHGDYRWHGKAPSIKEAEVFLEELETHYSELIHG